MGACASAPTTNTPLPQLPSAVRSLPDARVLPDASPDVRGAFQLQRVLGRGAFATTRLAKPRGAAAESFPAAVAIKSIDKARLASPLEVDATRREVEILKTLNECESVVSLYDAYEDDKHVHLALELCSGGELFDNITKRGFYSEACAASVLRTVVSTVAACHARGIVHRDLKPENLLLSNADDDHAPIKVTDFGLSAYWKPGQPALSDVVGTPYYVAPEVLRGRYNHAADIWSCGVIAYILLSGRPPFAGATEREVFDAVLAGRYDLESHPWTHISSGAKDVIRGMLTVDPRKRWTADRVLTHPWMAPLDGACGKNLVCKDAVFDSMRGWYATEKARRAAAAAIAADVPLENLDTLRTSLAQADADSDGRVSVADLKAALARAGSTATAKLVAKLLAAQGGGGVEYDTLLGATRRMASVAPVVAKAA